MSRRFGALASLGVCVLAAIHALAWAETTVREVRLFSQGRFARSYDKVVAGILPGLSLRFSDGAVFTVHEVLNLGDHGGTTAVVDIGEGRILRFPLTREAGQYTIKEYLAGYRKLKNSLLPIPRILQESPTGEYVAVQKIDHHFTLEEVISRAPRYREALSIHPEFAADLLPGLERFAERSAGVAYIGDFGPDQMVWTGRGWVLLDWLGQVQGARSVRDEHLFTKAAGFDGLPAGWRAAMIERVRAVRSGACLRKSYESGPGAR